MESKDNREDGKDREDDLDLGGEEDISFEHSSESKEDFAFEEVVSLLEDVILGEDFQNLQNTFCESHCDVFDESGENKLEYTTLFETYTRMIEGFIETRVKEAIPELTMSRLESMIASKKDELGGDVFEVMTTLGDFGEFKELMLSVKRAKNTVSASGKMGLDLSITGKHI